MNTALEKKSILAECMAAMLTCQGYVYMQQPPLGNTQAEAQKKSAQDKNQVIKHVKIAGRADIRMDSHSTSDKARLVQQHQLRQAQANSLTVSQLQQNQHKRWQLVLIARWQQHQDRLQGPHTSLPP